MLNLDAKIEAVLFWKAEPVAVKKLSEIFKVTEGEIRDALKILEDNIASRGLFLIRKDDEVMLGTNPELGGLIAELTKEELNRDLGKAGLETLAIVLYYGPVARRDIDYIRGVNSSFIIRNLLIRGLVEKIQDPKDQRSFLYKPTFELLSYLGVNDVEHLPEYEALKQELEAFKKAAENGEEGLEHKLEGGGAQTENNAGNEPKT